MAKFTSILIYLTFLTLIKINVDAKPTFGGSNKGTNNSNNNSNNSNNNSNNSNNNNNNNNNNNVINSNNGNNMYCYNNLCFVSGSGKPKTCEKQFKVASCTSCQKAIYSNSPDSAAECLPDPTIFMGFESYKSELDSYCGEKCDSGAVKKFLENIQTSCSLEISSAIKSQNDNGDGFNSSIKRVVTDFYKTIPLRNSYCLKNANQEYTILDVLNEMKNYLANSTTGAYLDDINEDFNPPSGFLTYNTDDGIFGTATPIPKNILCSDSYKDIVTQWINYTNSTPLIITDLKNLVDQSLAPVKGNLTSSCDFKFSSSSDRSSSSGRNSIDKGLNSGTNGLLIENLNLVGMFSALISIFFFMLLV
ncbi:hypothetical protein G9A89_009843 [Geosiphon pyriformis]|nr:hypothetical protein G9A89_009843 [Geosiphon pyriformis]